MAGDSCEEISDELRAAYGFYKPVEYADAKKVNNVERERAIRLYCTQRGYSWLLQVRAPMTLGTGNKEGKDFIVSGATLDKATMLELRDAIDAILAETGEPLSSADGASK